MRLKTIPLILTLLTLLTNCDSQDIFSKKRTIPPQINYSFPDYGNSTGFKTNSSMLLSFDTDMNKESLSTENIKLKDISNEAIACSIETYGERALVISPSTEGTFLSPDTGYMLSISKNIKDSHGNGMKKDFLVNFKTGTTHDSTRPRVIEDLTRVENNIIKVYFSEPLNPKTVEESRDNLKIYLQDENGEEVQCDFHYVAMDKALLVEPFSELKPNTSYGLTLASDSVKDLAGNYLGEEFIFNFINGEVEEDTTAPEVSMVEQSSAIIITFNEAIDTASLRLDGENPTIKFYNNFGYQYSMDHISILFTNNPREVVLTNLNSHPGEDFTEKMVLTTGITDLVGNELKEPKSFYIGQYEINNAEDYDYISGYNGIAGNLHIESDELTDLNNLESLEFINGNFTIRNCTNLTNIESLKSLSRVNGDIEIGGNPLLSSLNGMESIEECNMMVIINNNNLQNLSGLSSLKKINILTINYNEKLKNPSGLSSLEKINSLYIGSNQSLESLEGLGNLKAVEDITIEFNDNLTSLSGINNIKEVYATIKISHNPLLNNLNSLESIEKCGTMEISYNNNLKNLSGLSILKEIGFLAIYFNEHLESLEGMTSLESISLSISISNNPLLTNLQGIPENSTSNLTTLVKSENNSLESIGGMESLISLNRLDIRNNPALLSIDLPALESISEIKILGNENLENITLPNITEINSGQIMNNTSCATSLINDLLNSVTITGSVTVSGNAP